MSAPFPIAAVVRAFQKRREADRVIHNLDMSWNNAWEGTQQVHFITTDGSTLTYRSAPAKNPLDGKDCVHTVKFEKVGQPDA